MTPIPSSTSDTQLPVLLVNHSPVIPEEPNWTTSAFTAARIVGTTLLLVVGAASIEPIASLRGVELLGTVVILSGAVAGVGHLVDLGGLKLSEYTGNLSSVIQPLGAAISYTGTHLFLAGKYTFLSIAVPAYTMSWIVPKWIITCAMPQISPLVYQYLLIPMHNGIIQVTNTARRALTAVAQTIDTYVLQPNWARIVQVATWTWHMIAIPLGDAIVCAAICVDYALMRSIYALYDYVLKPAADAASWVWNTVLIPVKNALVDCICALYTHILKPTAVAIANATSWVWHTFIIPVGNILINVIQSIYQAVILPTGQFIGGVTVATYQTIKALSVIIGHNGQRLIAKVADTCNWVAQKATLA